jgi:TRAP-type C4-dicarboxylate transport system permease small subunit
MSIKEVFVAIGTSVDYFSWHWFNQAKTQSIGARKMSIKEMSLAIAATIACLVVVLIIATASNTQAAGTRIGPETQISYSDLCPEAV